MNKKNKCNFCLITFNDKEITQLPCSHSVCNVELIESIDNNLRKSNELLCPISGCITKIPINIIQILFPKNFKDYFFECENCKVWHSNKKLQVFKCDHKYCYKSLRKSNTIFCPKCENAIMYPEIYDMRLNYTNLLDKLKNKCKICKFSFRKRELYLLNCCERDICYSCLDSLVNEQNKNNNICPRKNCKTKLDIQSIIILLKERKKFPTDFKSENPPTNNIENNSKKKNSYDGEVTTRKIDKKNLKSDFYDKDKQKEDKKKINDYNFKKENNLDKNLKKKHIREPSFEKIDKIDLKLNKKH